MGAPEFQIRPIVFSPLFRLSAHCLSGIIHPAVQTNGRACQTVAPPKAQHPQPLRLKEPLAQANLESADYIKLAQRVFVPLAHLWERDGERGSRPPKGH